MSSLYINNTQPSQQSTNWNK